MAIEFKSLKVGNKILNVGNRIITISNNMLYLTYFNNFDNTTFIDIPIIGPSTKYIKSGSGSPTISNIQFGDYSIPSICNATTSEFSLWEDGVLDLNLPDIISVEWIEKYPVRGTSSFGMPGGIYLTNGSKSANFNACLTNVVGLEFPNGNNTLSTGWYSERSYSTTRWLFRWTNILLFK